MPRDGMRDVALAEDGEPGAGDETASDVGPAPQPRRPWLLLVGALALALAAVVVVDEIRARDRVARLAALPGLLEPMDSSLQQVWSQRGGWNHPAVHGPDLMVSLFDDPVDDWRLVANDIVTGEQRWDVALPEVASFYEAVACRVLGPEVTDVSTHIVCRLDVPVAAGVELPAYGPRFEARLVVLDAQTGEMVGDRSLNHGFGTVATLGSDVVVTTVLADGRVQVTREDPLTGRVRWTVQSQQPLPGAGTGQGPEAPQTQTEHGVISVDGPMAMALSEEGEVLGEWQVEGVQLPGREAQRVELTVLADGRFVVSTSNPAPGAPYGTVSASDARDGFPITGPVLEPLVDDGSASDLLLTAPPDGGEIVALDAQTGELRWSAAATPRSGLLLLDHRLIATAGSDLVALDIGTGERLWTVENLPQADHDLLTDGRVVLVPTVRAEESILTAVDITDGRVRWTAAGPPQVVTFFEIGSRLIALQQEQMIRLG